MQRRRQVAAEQDTFSKEVEILFSTCAEGTDVLAFGKLCASLTRQAGRRVHDDFDRRRLFVGAVRREQIVRCEWIVDVVYEVTEAHGASISASNDLNITISAKACSPSFIRSFTT